MSSNQAPLSPFVQLTSLCEVTWRYTVTSSDAMPSQHLCSGLRWYSPAQTLKITFFLPHELDFWPMILTIKLDEEFIKVNSHTLNSSAVRVLINTQTYRQTGLILLLQPMKQEVIAKWKIWQAWQVIPRWETLWQPLKQNLSHNMQKQALKSPSFSYQKKACLAPA